MGVAPLFFPNIDDDACPLERLSAIGDGDDRFGIDEEEQEWAEVIKFDVLPRSFRLRHGPGTGSQKW